MKLTQDDINNILYLLNRRLSELLSESINMKDIYKKEILKNIDMHYEKLDNIRIKLENMLEVNK